VVDGSFDRRVERLFVERLAERLFDNYIVVIRSSTL
jgi:hypothetical protein